MKNDYDKLNHEFSNRWRELGRWVEDEEFLQDSSIEEMAPILNSFEQQAGKYAEPLLIVEGGEKKYLR